MRVLAILLLLGFTLSAAAHDGIDHGAPSAPQVFPTETLSVGDIPVTDAGFHTEGFVTRFATAGTLILSFTYTNCETLCPITNAILASVDDSLGEQPIRIVTVSIDPAVDTPTALAATAEALGASARWTFLTAAPAENRMLLSALGVDVAALDEHDPMFLVGDVCTGRFTRVLGVPEPSALVALARAHAGCGS